MFIFFSAATFAFQYVFLFVFDYMGGFMFHYSWCLQTQTQTSHFYRPFSAISLFKYRHDCVLYTVPIHNLFMFYMWTLIKIDIACKIMDVVCVCMQRISMVVCETDFPLNIVSLYDNIGNAWRIKRIGEVH